MLAAPGGHQLSWNDDVSEIYSQFSPQSKSKCQSETSCKSCSQGKVFIDESTVGKERTDCECSLLQCSFACFTITELRKQKIYQPYSEFYFTSAPVRFELVTVTTALHAPDNIQNLAVKCRSNFVPFGSVQQRTLKFSLIQCLANKLIQVEEE